MFLYIILFVYLFLYLNPKLPTSFCLLVGRRLKPKLRILMILEITIDKIRISICRFTSECMLKKLGVIFTPKWTFVSSSRFNPSGIHGWRVVPQARKYIWSSEDCWDLVDINVTLTRLHFFCIPWTSTLM